MSDALAPRSGGPVRGGTTVVVTSMASDAHTWNLVFLQLLIEELGYHVVNLGPCVPDDLLLAEVQVIEPAVVVISSVNGHGHQDGMRLIQRLRHTERLSAVPVVIGGKLGVTEDADGTRARELMAAGFDAVFEDGVDPVAALRNFIGALPAAAPAAVEQTPAVAGQARPA
ncbi:cobalamin B12-binding domain-containing protein [Streptomyces sp. NPDC101151]|uniref:cobalamin B12-binding domain-containing protein n=1 Tax=Streptomyces sp. NPDC101151 TaxID=3366115 RepID=UPI0037FE078F